MIYFSTFITGFDKFIERELKKIFDDVRIIKLLDGLVVYETNSLVEKIKELKFFSNSFILLFERENINLNFPDRFVKIVLRDFDFSSISFINEKTMFRIIISKENEIIKIGNSLIKSVEDKISENENFVTDRANPDLEFWFLMRSGGLGLFGARITKHKDYKKILDKGELRPELANILIMLSEPKAEDVFLDPFAGSAAIPFERKFFPIGKIIASDINPKANRNNFLVRKSDATNLKDLEDNSVDKIVTDPPWGIFDKNIDLKNLYVRMLGEFVRLLRLGGILIILVANKDLFENILNKLRSKLKLVEKYNILVNGKKAGVYKIVKL